MCQHGHHQSLDVVGDDVIPTRDHGKTLRSTVQRQGPSGTDANVEILAPASRMNDIEQVVADRVIDLHRPHASLEHQDVLGGEDRAERIDRFAVPMAEENLAFLRTDRITHAKSDHEPVELAFRQDVSAFEFVGILRREDDEWRREGIGLPFDRDLAITHGLQQGDVVLGVVRLISSARITLANNGPGLKTNSPDGEW